MQDYKKYSYDGPVMWFDTCIAGRWKGETTAPSKEKALFNLAYRFKKENNQTPNTKITLPGKLTVVEEE